LRFSLDETELMQISGNIPWQQRAVTIPPAEHIVTWSYTKDGFGNAGADAGWVDDVSLTQTAVQISQTISFDMPVPASADPIPLTAIATSNLPVSYRVIDGPAEISGNWLVPG